MIAQDNQTTLEEALTKASPRLREKINFSVNLMRKAEKLALAYAPEEGFCLSFSGGKDSQALYHVAKLSGVKFKAYMGLTSVDPPPVLRFVRHHYPSVELLKPKDSIYNLCIKRHHVLPTMMIRWCCSEYKEFIGAGRVVLTGVRREESVRRSKRNEVEVRGRAYSGDLAGLDKYREEIRANKRKAARRLSILNAQGEHEVGCITGKESVIINAIISWTQRDVWEFLNDVVGVAHCELYDQGQERIGCINCPMSAKHWKHDNERYPHVKRNWLRTIKILLKTGGYSKVLNAIDGYSLPEDEQAEAVYEWWSSGRSVEQFAQRWKDRHSPGLFDCLDTNNNDDQ